MTPPRLLTTSQAAAYLGLTKRALELWRQRNGGEKLPFVKMGHSVRYRMEDLEEFVKARTRS